MATTQTRPIPEPALEKTGADFLELAAASEPGTVVTEHADAIDEALAKVTNGEKDVTWIQGQSCTGCTISLLQGEYPGLEDRLAAFRDKISFHPTLMSTSGHNALQSMDRSPDVLIVEGAIPTRVPSAATLGVDEFGNRIPILDWVITLAERADIVVAVGSCSAFGGLPGAGRTDPEEPAANPTGARGLQFEGESPGGVFGPDFESGADLPVVNVPGCPAHPDHVLLTLASVLNGHDPDLDEYNRPLPLFGPLVHDECSLREDYESLNFATKPGEEGCLYDVGCSGVYAYCDDSKRLRNGETSICRDIGAPCIGCVEPGFWDRFTPFYTSGQKRSSASDPEPIKAARGMLPDPQMTAFGLLVSLPALVFALPVVAVLTVFSYALRALGFQAPADARNSEST
jgi:hydrogenase small subunit